MAIAKKTLDFTNVREGSGVNPKRMPAGAYVATVKNIDDKPAKDGTDMWRFDMQLKQDPTAVYALYCKLDENQLWKLRGLLVAAGFNVPKKRMAIDPMKLMGKEVGIMLMDDEYDGKEKSTIDGTPFKASDVAGLPENEVAKPDDDDAGDDDLDEDDMEMELDDM